MRESEGATSWRPALLRSQIVLSILALVFIVAFVATSGSGSVIVLGMIVGLW